MDLLISAGHGGRDPGAVANGIKEKDWTLEASLYQYNRLKELGADVGLIRDDDTYLDSDDRSKLVRESGAKYCLDNHFNAGGGNGVETIHSIHASSDIATRLAHAVRDAGQPFRRVFTRKNSRGQDWYFMNRLTGSVQTTIIEYGFLDNDEDFSRLKDKSYREKLYEAVVKEWCAILSIPYHRTDENIQPFVNDKGETMMVRVKVPLLNVRSRPSWSDDAIHSQVKQGEAFTPVEKLDVSGSPMYRLKSGLFITGVDKYVDIIYR